MTAVRTLENPAVTSILKSQTEPVRQQAHTCYEIITASELAQRWHVPVTWIFSHTRSRTADAIPHLRFGKYIKFCWGSPELEAWFQRRMSGHSDRNSGYRNRLSTQVIEAKRPILTEGQSWGNVA